MVRFAAWLVARAGIVFVPAWLVAAAAAWMFLPGLSSGSSSPLGGLVPSHAEAIKAQKQEVDTFGNTLLTPIVVVQRAPGGLSTTQIHQSLATASRVDHRHSGALRVAAPLVSPDHTTIVTYLYFSGSTSSDDALAGAQQYANGLSPPGLRTGALLARNDELHQIQQSIPWVTAATVALIVVILLFTFRAIVPPLLVLASAGIAYELTVHVLAWIGEKRNVQLPKEVQPVLIALLLGLVTDYSVFFLSGMRRRLADGERRFAAATETARDNLPIIVTAGLIVTLGSLSLLAGKLGIFRAFGPGMALAVVIALGVATTFIPGLLALLGPAAFWPSLGHGEPSPHRRLWRFLTARPVSLAVAAALVAGLLACAAGLGGLKLGFTIIRGQPPGTEVKRAQNDAEKAFPAGIIAPTEILVHGSNLSTRLGSLRQLEAAVSRVPGVSEALGAGELPHALEHVFVSKDGSTARFLAVLDKAPVEADAIDVLRRVQARMPGLLAGAGLAGATASYAGDTALASDTVRAVRQDGFRVGIAVLLVNLVLLALFLRAIFAPIYLLAASVLAVGAALGGMTWIMQSGLRHDDVTYYVPFAAAVLLLSLGSDYNVFVVGRIWQAAREMPLREAIAHTAPRTSSAITTAGLTLGGSFALLAIVPLRPMRELALALALGILLDTFVVRSLLVPSLLALFRRREQGRVEQPPTRP